MGVARQYCGRLGKTDNCQIAVTLSLANHQMSLPIAYRLYLPETWANDAKRRAKAHVPEDVKFETKPQIALSQIEAALKAGVARGVVLADAGYGVDGAFRARLTALRPDLCRRRTIDVVGLAARRGAACRPSPGAARGGKPRAFAATTIIGRSRRRPSRCDCPPRPGSKWNGARAPTRLCLRALPQFVSGRRRATTSCAAPHPVEWLVVEWPEGEAEPTKYWLSTLPEDMPDRKSHRHHQAALAHRARLRRIEERTRPRSVRRARLARIPSSRQPLHRGLRIPASRTSRFSPLSPLAPRKTCRFRSYSILTLPRSARNGTWKTRSQRCESV